MVSLLLFIALQVPPDADALGPKAPTVCFDEVAGSLLGGLQRGHPSTPVEATRPDRPSALSEQEDGPEDMSATHGLAERSDFGRPDDQGRFGPLPEVRRRRFSDRCSVLRC